MSTSSYLIRFTKNIICRYVHINCFIIIIIIIIIIAAWMLFIHHCRLNALYLCDVPCSYARWISFHSLGIQLVSACTLQIQQVKWTPSVLYSLNKEHGLMSHEWVILNCSTVHIGILTKPSTFLPLIVDNIFKWVYEQLKVIHVWFVHPCSFHSWTPDGTCLIWLNAQTGKKFGGYYNMRCHRNTKHTSSVADHEAAEFDVSIEESFGYKDQA